MNPTILNKELKEVGEKTSSRENNVPKRGFLNKLFNWRPSQDNIFLIFFRESTLHGLKYVGIVNIHTVERIIWLICIATLTFLSVGSVIKILEKFFANPIMVTFQPYEIGLEQIPFPAVTICNVNNRIKRSKAMELIERHKKAPLGSLEWNETLMGMYLFKTICDNAATFSRQFSYGQQNQFPIGEDDMLIIERERDIKENVAEMVTKAAQNCSAMIKLCSWRDSPKKCEDLFFPVMTDFGECCVFNMMPIQLLKTTNSKSSKKTHHYHEQSLERLKKWESFNIDRNILANDIQDLHGPPKHQRKGGMKAGLSFMVDTEEDEYFCPAQNAVGFQLLADSPIDFPKVKDFGIAIKPQTETYLDVRPELTMIHDNILGLDVSKRHCYFNKEWPLKYFKYYTSKNCIAECLSDLTYNQCNCRIYTMPRWPNQTICLNDDYECARIVERNMSKLGFKTLCKDCLPACTQIKYDLSISQLPLPLYEGKYIWKYKNASNHNDHDHDDDDTDDRTKYAPWVNANVSIIHVYFGTDSVYSRVRQRIFDVSDLIGSGGGLLGLYLGFSLISALEIFYFFILKMFFEKDENGQYAFFQIFRNRKRDQETTKRP